MTSGTVANRIGESYSSLYSARTGRRKLKVSTARKLASYIRGKADRLRKVADALERAADVEESTNR